MSSYFDRHDEAETLFREIDRKDLAVSLRERLGDWFRVVQVRRGIGTKTVQAVEWLQHPRSSITEVYN